jgi:hypothetical protein
MRQNPDGEKEIRPARNPPLTIGGQSATGNDTMQVRVKLEVLSPTVQDREEADLGSQVLRVSRDCLQGFRRGLEENVVHYLLVLVGNRGYLFRHSEDHVKIWNIEKLSLPLLDPLRPGQALAFGTVSIPAAIEGIAFKATLIATFEVAAECRGAAHLDGAHDAPLRSGHRRAMLLSIRFSVTAEYVRHFQLRTVHAASSEVLRCGGWWFNGYRTGKQVEWARCRAHLAGGDPQVTGGGRQTTVAQQELNGADVRSRLQQMNSERMAHGMGSYGLPDAGTAAALLAGQFDRISVHRLLGSFALEEPPSPRSDSSPILTERLQ